MAIDRLGKVISVGDVVKLYENATTTVVCDISGSIYTQSFKKEDWDYLKSGILVISDEMGLLHVDECDGIIDVIKI